MGTPMTSEKQPTAVSGVDRLGRTIVSCDQECWIKDRIRTAVRMIHGIHQHHHVRADDPIRDHAIEGVINGAAIEIIHTLRMEPEWVNLHKLFEDKPW